ncbi:MAG: type II toxin-antitoxin system VapC family toxin [Kiritimatiellae bacterium]|nr:type II toxin-antitoxin system VapC family toxin [Kiritimatiellia bacterium]
MIFDTDIFIWIQRGSVSAAHVLERQGERLVSVQTYLELLQGAKNAEQQNATRRFLKDFSVQVVPLMPEIGRQAMSLVDRYALSHGMRAGDAIVAATALATGQTLCTSNERHFRQIPQLDLVTIKP